MKKGIKKNKQFFAAIFLLSLSACGDFQINSDCECGFYTSSSGIKIHWNDGSRVKFVTHSDMPEAHRLALTHIEKSFNETLNRTQISIDVTSNSAPSMTNNTPDSVSGDGINGIYYVRGNWPFYDTDNTGKKITSNADAMTVIRADPRGLIEADIFFREESFRLTSAEERMDKLSPQETALWIQKSAPENVAWMYKVGAHEMGHAMGLVHTSKKSIMTPQVSLNPLDKLFTDRDITTIAQVYDVKLNTTANALIVVEESSPTPSRFADRVSDCHTPQVHQDLAKN